MELTPDQMRKALANRQPEKASEALGKHEGKTLMVTQADRTKVGGGYLGGPGFSGLQHTNPEYAGKAWGVLTPNMASTIMGSNRRVPEGQALWSTLIGTPEQHSSNQMVYDKLVNDFKKQAKAGLLSPELREKINARLSAIADKEGVPFFGAGADIMDPKTHKAADTFAKRRIIADLIGGHGVGGKKGQIGAYDKIMHGAAEPLLRDLPTHAVGPRLFNLSGETSHRPDLHSAFPQMLHGEDYGQMYHPVPKEVMLRDFMQQVQDKKGRKPGYYDLTMGLKGEGLPAQHLSEEFLTHLQKHGYADGGGVSQDEMLAHIMLHKADGGAVQPDQPDGTSTDKGYYEGGPADNSGTDPMQYKAEGGAVEPANIGVEEAPEMQVKLYMPPGGDNQNGMPVGGVDFQPDQAGQQMLPAQQAPQGQPPQGAPSQPQAPQGAGMPQMGQAPAMPPTGGAGAPTGPQSNILNMTPQGQAMSAMRASPPQQPRPGMPMLPMGRPAMPKMATGGKVSTARMKEALLKHGMPLYADGGEVSRETIKPVAHGIIKERVTVAPDMDAMKYELMSAKRITKKAK
ncbi:hypothetical protein UFOVP56_32 [uncultured Caudovirales phage]|uniref:Uncharacterized protein n=1 Tax=uncultured Caudovirales phage TaxID=2100421 RepID=A0A6J5T8B0_9CAUD|nr:hypothetical protein UFOVP56_32 [uncultured Caudovirales phage]